MKRFVILVVLCAVFLGGCDVLMTPQYSNLLDKTCALSDETAKRAVAGELTETQKTEALVKQAETWRLFANARDGVK